MKEKLKPREIAGLLGALLLLGLAVYGRLVFLGGSPEDDHLVNSALACFYLKSGELSRFLVPDPFYPPLVYQVSSLVYLLFPPGLITGVMSQWPFWAVLLTAVYGIGKNLFSRFTGALSAFFLLTCPLVLWHLGVYKLDLPVAALAALTFYFYLKTENFQRRGYALLFGVSLGLTLLTKWWSGVLLAPLLAYLLWAYLLEPLKNWKARAGLLITGALWIVGLILSAQRFPLTPRHPLDWGFTGFLLGWGILAVLLLRFWGRQAGPVFSNFAWGLIAAYFTCGWLYFNPAFSVLNGSLFFGVAWGNYAPVSWLDYPQRLLTSILGPLYCLFLLTGAATILKQLRGRRDLKIWLFTLLSSLLIILLEHGHDNRYFLPWLALAAPLAVFWLEECGKAKPFLVGILCLAGVCGFLGFSGPQSFPFPPGKTSRVPLAGIDDLIRRTLIPVLRKDRVLWLRGEDNFLENAVENGLNFHYYLGGKKFRLPYCQNFQFSQPVGLKSSAPLPVVPESSREGRQPELQNYTFLLDFSSGGEEELYSRLENAYQIAFPENFIFQPYREFAFPSWNAEARLYRITPKQLTRAQFLQAAQTRGGQLLWADKAAATGKAAGFNLVLFSSRPTFDRSVQPISVAGLPEDPELHLHLLASHGDLILARIIGKLESWSLQKFFSPLSGQNAAIMLLGPESRIFRTYLLSRGLHPVASLPEAGYLVYQRENPPQKSRTIISPSALRAQADRINQKIELTELASLELPESGQTFYLARIKLIPGEGLVIHPL